MAVLACGVFLTVAVLAPAVLLTVACQFVAVPVAVRWATGVLPAVAARAANPAGSTHAAQAVTAARPG